MKDASLSNLANPKLLPRIDGAASVKLWLVAVPPLVTGMAGSGVARGVGLGIGFSWFVLLAVALIRPRLVALLLPVSAAAWCLTALQTLPFNSAPFVVNTWATLMMCLMTLPRGRTSFFGPDEQPHH